MIKRVRDKIRQFKPQEIISYEEWEQIEDRFIQASNFIKPTNDLYLIMKADLEEGERIILENRVHEVREVRIISELLQKIFITPKDEQMNELVGQIKYIRGYLAELTSWIDRKVQLEKLEAAGKIIIHKNKEISNE